MSHVPLQYIDGFRFRMMIDWQPQGIARVSPIEFFSSRHGNLTIRPVTIEAGVVAGRAGFAALVTRSIETSRAGPAPETTEMEWFETASSSVRAWPGRRGLGR